MWCFLDSRFLLKCWCWSDTTPEKNKRITHFQLILLHLTSTLSLARSSNSFRAAPGTPQLSTADLSCFQTCTELQIILERRKRTPTRCPTSLKLLSTVNPYSLDSTYLFPLSSFLLTCSVWLFCLIPLFCCCIVCCPFPYVKRLWVLWKALYKTKLLLLLLLCQENVWWCSKQKPVISATELIDYVLQSQAAPPLTWTLRRFLWCCERVWSIWYLIGKGKLVGLIVVCLYNFCLSFILLDTPFFILFKPFMQICYLCDGWKLARMTKSGTYDSTYVN